MSFYRGKDIDCISLGEFIDQSHVEWRNRYRYLIRGKNFLSARKNALNKWSNGVWTGT